MGLERRKCGNSIITKGSDFLTQWRRLEQCFGGWVCGELGSAYSGAGSQVLLIRWGITASAKAARAGYPSYLVTEDFLKLSQDSRGGV